MVVARNTIARAASSDPSQPPTPSSAEIQLMTCPRAQPTEVELGPRRMSAVFFKSKQFAVCLRHGLVARKQSVDYCSWRGLKYWGVNCKRHETIIRFWRRRQLSEIKAFVTCNVMKCLNADKIITVSVGVEGKLSQIIQRKYEMSRFFQEYEHKMTWCLSERLTAVTNIVTTANFSRSFKLINSQFNKLVQIP